MWLLKLIPSNRPVWPLVLVFWLSLAYSRIFSMLESIWFLSAILSKTPAFIKLSKDFLLRSLELVLVRKSSIEMKGPFAFLSLTTTSTILEPTFLIAESPNLIWFFFGTTLKKVQLSFMSGGRTVRPIFLHSSIRIAILSTSFLSEVKRDD